MAMSRGVMLGACAEAGIPGTEIDFQQARRHVLGRGNLSKQAVPELLRDLGLAVPTRDRGGIDYDVADAIVIALFGLWESSGPSQDNAA